MLLVYIYLYFVFNNAVAVEYTYFTLKTKMSAAKRNFNELNFSEIKNNWAPEIVRVL